MKYTKMRDGRLSSKTLESGKRLKTWTLTLYAVGFCNSYCEF